jgi:hypothetical protein
VCSEKRKAGGEGGIRTHVTIAREHAFQACSFSHSDTSPGCVCRRFRAGLIARGASTVRRQFPSIASLSAFGNMSGGRERSQKPEERIQKAEGSSLDGLPGETEWRR